MIQLTLDCVTFGDLALTGASGGAFEVLRLSGAGAAKPVARIEVEPAHIRKLTVTRLHEGERLIDPRATAGVDKVVLETWRDDAPSHYELWAARTADGLEIVLSGDCRHRLVRWSTQFSIRGEEVVVHGPFLANDLST